MTTFSKRHGYGANVVPAPISVREDAPYGFRGVLVDIANESLSKPSAVREVVCRVLRVRADDDNWTEFPNIDREVRELLDDAPWYKVYDIVEEIFSTLVRKHRHDAAANFAHELNDYFIANGIGWELHDGKLRYRGPEGFEAAVKAGHSAVLQNGHRTAASELHEAISDLSRRPHPDRTGAVQHAMASLECVARDVCGSTATLGDLIRARRDLLPKPLDVAVEKIWGFTSERGRHLLEGREPSEQEAELIVGLAAALGAYLAKLGR